MSAGSHRALIVDQDSAVQRLTVAALATHGFACDVADDAALALEKLSTATYDVAIVDLKVPIPSGKPLALELANSTNRPLVVVHTDVIDPKLAHELIERGVDGVMFKPVDVTALATKVRSLVDGRKLSSKAAAEIGGPGSPKPTQPASEHRVSLAQLNEKLREVSSVLPISTSAPRCLCDDAEPRVGSFADRRGGAARRLAHHRSAADGQQRSTSTRPAGTSSSSKKP